jgi:pimeloyl-ACP methyl ester carboxylesterase
MERETPEQEASTTAAADGATIAFDVRGAGAALVLVHGITETRRAWDPVTDALASRWRVVRIDARRHGDSERRPPYDPLTMAGDVRAVVDALALDAPLVVGHSMGGVVVSAYGGLGHPARGIVNVDQPLQLAGFKDALAGIRPLLEGDDAGFRTAIDLVFGALDGPLPEPERARLRALSSPERDVVLGVWGAVLDQTIEELGAQVEALVGGTRVPYLSLHGSDPGPDYAPWLTRLVPQAQVEVWPDLGHYPHLLAPDRFVARLAEFDPAG